MKLSIRNQLFSDSIAAHKKALLQEEGEESTHPLWELGLLEIQTEPIWFAGTKTISHACHLANNIYNEANYAVWQYFFTISQWIRCNALHWPLKDVKQSPNYKNLPAQTVQQILRLLDKNWKFLLM